ncbi:MAG: phage baseplate assembly protein [Limnobacter sp.]|uniref:phage baseplate assembly protein n=1 Tax=Limnobacter sp. TaxID=2003368 RepID=UPI00391DE1E2
MTDASTKLTLKVNGQIYSGWKSVSIRQGIEQIAGTFELSITDRWPDQTLQWSISPGEFCEVLIGEDPVITGYVDKVSTSYDAGSHTISVVGRDKTGDLVDCSAPSVSFSSLSFLQIASKLAEPFDIKVIDQTIEGGKGKSPRRVSNLAKWSTQNGESVHRTLERIARSEGVMLVSDSKGSLLITRSGLGGKCIDSLELGKNILKASSEQNHSALYSEITVKGQSSAAGASQFDLSRAQPKASVKREVNATSGSKVGRYRPLVVVAESQADAARCQTRARWEVSNREAKARRISVTVQGWRQSDGSLWGVNKLVKLVCPWMRVDGQFLIASISMRLDESGTTSDLELVDPRAFDELAEIPQPAAGPSSGKFNVVGK